MNIPKIWVKAEREIPGKRGPMQLTAWGWSETDRTKAQRLANEKLQRMVSRVEQAEELSHDYGYGTRAMREEIIQELHGRAGEVAAVVTRNRAGCLVLNTTQVMFIDVDLPRSALPEWMRRLFLRRPPVDVETLDRVKTRLKEVSTATFRIYRTAAGFRLLATDRLFQPGSSESENIMKAVAADPAFVRLCRVQESFRARLTPKPWRCGLDLPPSRYPREDNFDKERFAAWLAGYEQNIVNKSTCRLLEEVGSGWVHDQVQPILRLHDEATKVSASLALA
jgi:hypothetical protein